MNGNDQVLRDFLYKQYDDGRALAAESEILELHPLGPAPVRRYAARFHCRGLIRDDNAVREHDDFLVGIGFPDDYLRRFDTTRVLTWLEPFRIWHPNVRPPFVCVGRMEPGSGLVDLIYQLYEMITYHNVEMREPNALNHDACAWARRNVQRFPLDRRPLRRRRDVRTPQQRRVAHEPGVRGV